MSFAMALCLTIQSNVVAIWMNNGEAEHNPKRSKDCSIRNPVFVSPLNGKDTD